MMNFSLIISLEKHLRSSAKKKTKKRIRKKMICEFQWNEDGEWYIGILQRHNVEYDSQRQNIEQKVFLEHIYERKCLQKKFPLLCSIFGIQNFVTDFAWHADLHWFEEKLIQEHQIRAWIWYPPSFENPSSTFEEVDIYLESKFDIRLESLDKDKINFYKIPEYELSSVGLQILTHHTLTSVYNLDLQSKNALQVYNIIYEQIQKCHHPDRQVNARQIYYLTSRLFADKQPFVQEILHLGIDIKNFFAKQLHLNNLTPLLSNLLQLDEGGGQQLELFDAFVCVIPANKQVNAQTVHRDSLYESVSLFFYLKEPCDPQTGFFTFSHRLLTTVKQGIGTYRKPQIQVGDILLMSGKMLHHGLASTTIHDTPRLLFIFQYRKKMKRLERSQLLATASEAQRTFPELFPTSFDV